MIIITINKYTQDYFLVQNVKADNFINMIYETYGDRQCNI